MMNADAVADDTARAASAIASESNSARGRLADAFKDNVSPFCPWWSARTAAAAARRLGPPGCGERMITACLMRRSMSSPYEPRRGGRSADRADAHEVAAAATV